MRVGALFVVFMFLCTCGCTPRFIRLKNPDQIESGLQLIAARNAQIEQIKASVAIKGIGIVGHLFHEQADIVARAPQYLLWSMRSFFESPATLIASNGEFITIYDFSGNSAKSYDRLPLNNNSVIDLFDFKIHPRFLIDLLLTRIPLADARSISISEKDALLELKAELFEQWSLRCVFEKTRGVVMQISLRNAQSDYGYELSYENFSQHNGIWFPSLYVVRAFQSGHELTFSMRMKRLELNGVPMAAENFYLKPH